MNKAVKWLSGWASVLFCYYSGVFLSAHFELVLPGTLIGLFLLLGALFTFHIVEPLVSTAVAPLLKHMSVLFVPAVLGVSVYWPDIQRHGLAIVVAVVLFTAFSLGVTAKIASKLMWHRHPQGDRGNQ